VNGERLFAAGPPPRQGEHTREILQPLGYEAAELEELARQGIVGIPEDGMDQGIARFRS